MLFGENSTESILGFILNITSQVLSFLFFSFFRDEDLQPAKLAKEAMVPAELWKLITFNFDFFIFNRR